MGSSPKQQDYQPTKSDKALASKSLKDWDKFQNLYNPALLNLKDQAASGDVKDTLRARSNADTMQAISKPSYQMANSTDIGGKLGSALSGQLGQANVKGKKFQNDLETSILATRQGQAGVASQGLADLAKMETTSRLKKLESEQKIKGAKNAMTGQLVTATVTGAGKAGVFGEKGTEFFNNFNDALKGQGG